MPLRPYLQLIRVPNVFTAATQSLAGYLLAGGRLETAGSWIPLVLASASIYAAGIALNDYFDIEIDRVERPRRPLPSGAVSRRFAGIFGAIGLILGPCLAALSSPRSGLAGLILASSVLLYDAGLRRTVLGPQVMGLCRGLNLLMGLGWASDFSGPAGWIAAGSLAVFVTGMTWISRWETETGRVEGLTAGIVLENLGLAGLLAAALRIQPFPADSGAERFLPLEGLLILLIVGLYVNSVNAAAVREPVPARMQAAVKAAILSLSWIDVGLTAAVVGLGPAAVVALFWLPAPFLAKRIAST
ncbi:MAG: UbiA family prenyltransferase [Isosphaeraceae bacterium]|nr:UbiA family prenyltransferase [Isosphaeraceae bacterium]